jgi:hypothetical protein
MPMGLGNIFGTATKPSGFSFSLNSGQNTSPSFFKKLGFNTGYEQLMAETGVGTGVLQYLYYFIMATILLLLVLTLIHFTVKPIFKTSAGGQGIIPLPGSKVDPYWKQEVGILEDTKTPLSTSFENWSMILDIQIDNPTSNTNYPRILFHRGSNLAQPSGTFGEQDTILTIDPNFNLVMYLDRLTNDLNIAVQTISPNPSITQPFVENITISNFPVGKAVRVGVMVGSKVLEVYLNGQLYRSKSFASSLKKITGSIYPPFDNILSSTARVKNLYLFPYPLTPSGFRAYGTAESFELKNIPDSCSA